MQGHRVFHAIFLARLDHTSRRSGALAGLPKPASTRRYLFLLGTPGPFFHQLAVTLGPNGHVVRRIHLNGGDEHDWPGAIADASGPHRATCYRGTQERWLLYIDQYLRRQAITDMVLFGNCRPMQMVAHQMARLHGLRIHLIEDGCHPVRLIRGVAAVYTETSLIGFEALLHGRPVHCFGMPFYAGGGADARCDALPGAARGLTMWSTPRWSRRRAMSIRAGGRSDRWSRRLSMPASSARGGWTCEPPALERPLFSQHHGAMGAAALCLGPGRSRGLILSGDRPRPMALIFPRWRTVRPCASFNWAAPAIAALWR